MQEIKINHIYRHFKGNKYKVLHIARHSETMELYVVYQVSNINHVKYTDAN